MQSRVEIHKSDEYTELTGHGLSIEITGIDPATSVSDIQREAMSAILRWTEGCFADTDSQ